MFPYYLSIGMTPDEYWNGDAMWPRAYHKAAILKQERENYHAWLQGLYVYEAIGCMSPVLRAFSKSKKPEKYPAEPHDLKLRAPKTEAQAKKEVTKQDNADKKAMAYMQMLMISHNASFEKKSKDKK